MRIAINLLPPEIRAQEVKKAKFYKIQFAGVAVILVMVFLSSLTVVLRILQSRNIAEVQANLNQTQQRISDLKNTEASLFLLKNRLTVISQYLGVSTKQSSMYKLMDKLVPPSIIINAINIDRKGDTVFMAVAPDPLSLDTLIESLISKESNEEMVKNISLESLNRGRDGFYRISFTIKSK